MLELSRRTLLAGGAVAAVAGPLSPLPAAATPGRPWTIPALREWTTASGSFSPGTPIRVVVRPADASALYADAETFASDLRALTGAEASVLVHAGVPRAGEFHLHLGADDPQLGTEGYALSIGSAAVITANAAAGAFYGTRSILQLLRQNPTIPAGSARDWPRYAERGLLLDIGRKHLTHGWIAERIREMAYLKLNYLHLHFTEDLGWRIESDRSPRVHSEDDFLTKAEVADLVALAARHHVEVVPETDVPGHAGAMLRNYPELQLRDVFGQRAAGKLDFTIPAARRLAKDLIEEYLPLFPGSRWSIGGDEFLPAAQYWLYPQLARFATERHGAGANVQDGIIGFLNEIGDLLRGHGKTVRVAHDGMTGGNKVALDRRTTVEWWTDFSPTSTTLPTPQQLVDAGYRVHNAGWYPCNYSNLGIPLPPKPDLRGMYEIWAVHRFRGVLFVDGVIGGPYHDISPASLANTGSHLAQWNDAPDEQTEAQIAVGIHPRLRIMAQKTWESPALVPTYAEFAAVIDRVGRPPLS